MLIMVIENPIQFTIVSAVAFISADAFLATNVEKSGESAITTIPQKSRKPINKLSDLVSKSNGETRQHTQDNNNVKKAIRLAPNFCPRYPLSTQAKPPIPIIRKDNTGILNTASGCALL